MVIAVTLVSCPECGNDLSMASLKEGDQTTTQCENCTSELLIAIEDGELRASTTNGESTEETDDEEDYY